MLMTEHLQCFKILKKLRFDEHVLKRVFDSNVVYHKKLRHHPELRFNILELSSRFFCYFLFPVSGSRSFKVHRSVSIFLKNQIVSVLYTIAHLIIFNTKIILNVQLSFESKVIVELLQFTCRNLQEHFIQES